MVRRAQVFEIESLARLIVGELREEGLTIDCDVRRQIREYMYEVLAANPIMSLPEGRA
jgi:hypothetical protein